MKKQGRSIFLKLLILGFLLLSWFGWLRLVQALSQADFLEALGVHIPVLYLALSGAAWGVAGIVCAVALWTHQGWASWTARITTLVCAAWYWLDRLLLAIPGASQVNVPFAIGLCLVLAAAVFLFTSFKSH